MAYGPGRPLHLPPAALRRAGRARAARRLARRGAYLPHRAAVSNCTAGSPAPTRPPHGCSGATATPATSLTAPTISALLVEHGLNVFIFDYRGYGRSEGRPSEPGFYADAAAAYDYLRSTAGVPPQQIVLYGRSLGAPVAAELALRRPAAGLILEAPLGSITAMARTVIPLVPLEKLFRARFDTLARAPRLQLPTLVMVAERDDVIPPAQARQIFAALPGPKEIWTIPGAHHNNTYVAGGTAYFEQLTGFIRRVTTTASA